MISRPRARLAALVASLTLTITFAAGVAAADPETPAPSEPASPSAQEPPPSATPSEPAAPTAPLPAERGPEPAPPPRAAADEWPQLETTADFDKPSYRTGELIKLEFTVKNAGTTRVTGLHASERLGLPNGLVLRGTQWGDLSASKPGLTLEPGASYRIPLQGRQHEADADTVVLNGHIFGSNGVSVHEFTFKTAVTKTYGHAGGIVYGDLNNNGQFDTGEGLAGVELRWFYVENFDKAFTATTDRSGRFTYPQLPAVSYYAAGSAPDGWKVSARSVTIDDSDKNDNLRIRAVKPVGSALKASLKFTKDTYRPGEIAHVTVTLANTSTGPLTGIVANCNRGGFGESLTGRGPGWGDLATDGVTIPAGQTKVYDVTEKVPDITIHTGYVSVGCDFGYAGVEDPNAPSAIDRAKVPGGIAATNIEVKQYTNGLPSKGIAGVRVVLTDERTCPIVAEGMTDQNGFVRFTGLAPGPGYMVYLFPPAGWKIKQNNPTRPEVRGDREGRLTLEAEPGDGPLPTLPAQPAECSPPTTTPVPADTTPVAHSGLASTGANVIGMTIFGALTLLLGSAAIIVARRRRT